jgi:hypothetical protein
MRSFEFPFPLTMARIHMILSSLFSEMVVSVTAATVTITKEAHAAKVIVLNRAAGVTATLPAALGRGDVYEFVVGTTVTSNNDIIKVANASDTMIGLLETATTTGATTNGFCEAAGGTDDTITMNGTTTGGIAGSRVLCRDVALNKWLVVGDLVGSGTLATSLSATV